MPRFALLAMSAACLLGCADERNPGDPGAPVGAEAQCREVCTKSKSCSDPELEVATCTSGCTAYAQLSTRYASALAQCSACVAGDGCEIDISCSNDCIDLADAARESGKGGAAPFVP